MRFDRDTLGPYLYRERERRGITVDAISARTKIARSHLVRLERGDVSEWPKGIFRRAFFREYVTAIGLDADDLLPEFLRIFPDPSDAPGDALRPGDHPSDALRLTLAEPSGRRNWRARLAAACVDALIIVMAAGLVSLLIGHWAAACAVVAVLYHAVVTASGATTLGAWLVARDRLGFPALWRRSTYTRSSLPSHATMKITTRAATTAAVTASDSHQTHGSFAHHAPVIR